MCLVSQTPSSPAALVHWFASKKGRPHLSLETLRAELAATLENHQLPSVLRKLDAETEIPKTHSGKPDVKKAFAVFLPQTVEGDIRTLPSEVEVWESAPI